MAVVSSTLPEGIGLIEIKGAFLGGQDTDDVRSAVARFVEAGQRKLLIDAGEVTYLNSAAVGVLVAAHISYARRQWRLAVCGENKAVYGMLAITKLNLVLTTFDTRKQAIRWFGD